MSAEIIEALTLDCSWQKGFEYVLGFLKLGDLASDVLFINTVFEFDTYFTDAKDDDGKKAVNAKAVIVVSIIFTSVGFVIDFFRARQLLKVYLRHFNMSWTEMMKEVFLPGMLKKMLGGNVGAEADARKEELKQKLERKKKQQACWWRSNVIFEEIPQFIILAGVAGGLSGRDMDCNNVGEKSKDAKRLTQSWTKLFVEEYR